MAASAPDKTVPHRSDVFISYSRKDREFVKRLEDALERRGRETWVDWQGIRPAEEFMQAIFPAIEGTDTFIFVLSPDSVTSEICGKELAHAVSHNKRMIPIMARDTDAKAVPEPLAKLNWVFARDADSFEAAADFLISALDTDLGWIRAHTRLLTRAIEWEAKTKSNSFVLRGEDLRAAEQWLAQAGTEKERQPTALQTEYIIASRKNAARRMRITLGAVSAGFVIAVVLAIVALFARQEASKARQIAIEQRDVAVAQQKISRSRELAATALAQLPVDPELTLLLGLEAAKSAPTTQAETALRQGLIESHLERAVAAFEQNVRYSVFSPDGKRIFTVCDGGSGRIWSSATGEIIAEVREAESRREPVFSEDGTTILTVSYDGTARLYDSSSGKVIENFRDYATPILDAVFTPRGIVLVTGEAVPAVWLHSPRQKVGELPVAGTVKAATLSPNGKHVTVSQGDGKTSLWSVAPGRMLTTWTAEHYSTVFSPNSRRLVHGMADYSATVRDAESGEIVSELRGHDGALKTYCFGPDSKTVATGSYDQTARIWETETGRQIAELRGHTYVILKVAFTPGGKLLVTSSSDNTARIWEIETQRTLAHLRGHSGEVGAVTFSPDARQVVTGGRDRVARVWNVPRRMKLLGHTDGIWEASFSPDSKFVVSAAGDNIPRVWNAETGKQTVELSGHTGPARRAVFSPDGKRILTASDDKTARLWNAATGESLMELPGHTEEVWKAIFSPDGSRILTISGETVRLFESATGRVEGEMHGKDGRVWDAVFSPDGKRIATANANKTACLWDVATRTLTATMGGHSAPVLTVAFDSKGSRLVTASEDMTARIWNVANAELLKELRGRYYATEKRSL